MVDLGDEGSPSRT
jgi:hypothetical protein